MKKKIIVNIMIFTLIMASTMLFIKNESNGVFSDSEGSEGGISIGENRPTTLILYENGERRGYKSDIEGSNMATILTQFSGSNFKIGKKYDDIIKLECEDSFGCFVRANIYKCWVDEAGNKVISADPSLIEIETAQNSDGWYSIEAAGTAERQLLMYKYAVMPGESTIPPTIKSIKINPTVNNIYSVEKTTGKDGCTKTTMTKTYQGLKPQIDVVFESLIPGDDVPNAILRTWGSIVTVDEEETMILTCDGQTLN